MKKDCASEFMLVCSRVNRPLIVYAVVLVITLLWIALIFATPALLAEGHAGLALILYRGFSAVCHQIPGRSFDFHGAQLGVCSRCTGIYAGFALGLIVYPLIRPLKEIAFPPRQLLIAAAVPLTIDFSLGALHLWENSFFSRTVTGIFFGFVVAFFILPGFVSAFTEYRSNNQTRNAVFNQ